MAAKGRRERRRITYDDIFLATGISRSTLGRLANDQSELLAMATIDRLCVYFECQPGDLLIFVPDD